MITIQFVSGVKRVVTQRISVNGVKIDVNLKGSYRNGLKVNIGDNTECLDNTLKIVSPSPSIPLSRFFSLLRISSLRSSKYFDGSIFMEK